MEAEILEALKEINQSIEALSFDLSMCVLSIIIAIIAHRIGRR